MTEMLENRHPIHEADENSLFGSLTPLEFYDRHSVVHSSSTFINPQGLEIFTQSWVPKIPSDEIKGIICMVHGYTGESNWFLQLTSMFFAKSGFAVCALDHQGHGFSQGLPSHIPDIRPLVTDCVTFFHQFLSKYPSSVPRFLYSESLGGAIALLIHLTDHSLYLEDPGGININTWNGIVLNGAMCGISEKIKPQWPLEHLLSIAAYLVPTWKIVPTKGTIVDVSFKLEWKRKLAMASPNRKKAAIRPRAATALELVRVCKDLQGRFEEIKAPLLIIHGSEDILCDPACVQELYHRASSNDKTIKIYPGMLHQLIGESEEDVDLIFGETLQWLISKTNTNN